MPGNFKLICIICMDAFACEDAIHITNCGHLFHLHCLENWRSRSNDCPECRKEHIQHHKVFLHFEIDDEDFLRFALEASKYENEIRELQDKIDYMTVQSQAREANLKEMDCLLKNKMEDIQHKTWLLEGIQNQLKIIPTQLVNLKEQFADCKGFLEKNMKEHSSYTDIVLNEVQQKHACFVAIQPGQSEHAQEKSIKINKSEISTAQSK